MDNEGKIWTNEHILFLRGLASVNTPTGIIALKMGRTESAIRAKANSIGLSLAPTNQSPYDRNYSNKKKDI